MSSSKLAKIQQISVSDKLTTSQESFSFATVKRWLTFLNVSDDSQFNFVLSLAAMLVPLCYVAESTSPTAYGRFGENVDPKFAINPKLGWFLMELPVTLSFVYYFYIKKDQAVYKPKRLNSMRQLLGFIFLCQYLYRGFYFPYKMNASKNAKNFSLVTVIGASSVCFLNGYLTAKFLRYHGNHLGTSLKSTWVKKITFWIGSAVYYTGLVLLIQQDAILRDLRSTPGPRYKIPQDGLFKYATCPQYFAELMTWIGWTIMTRGPPGLFMVGVTLMNLPLRAVATHRWYIEKFGEDYPADRAYMIPFIW